MLSSSEIAALRTEATKTFDQTLDVYRGSVAATDAYGGRGKGTPTLTHSGIACEVYPGVAHVVDVADFSALVSTQAYTVTLPVGTDIQKDDILEITSQGNLRLAVRVILEPESLELQMRVLADKESRNEMA